MQLLQNLSSVSSRARRHLQAIPAMNAGPSAMSEENLNLKLSLYAEWMIQGTVL